VIAEDPLHRRLCVRPAEVAETALQHVPEHPKKLPQLHRDERAVLRGAYRLRSGSAAVADCMPGGGPLSRRVCRRFPRSLHWVILSE
jgi:hypothetical protein